MKKTSLKGMFFLASFIVVGIIFNMSTTLSGFEVQREILYERRLLNQIEEELAKFRQIAEERQVILGWQDNRQNDKIIDRFAELTEEFDSLLEDAETTLLEEKHMQIRYLFKDIDIIEDVYLYYNGVYFNFRNDIEAARKKLIQLTDNHPNSKMLEDAFHLLQEINIRNGFDHDYIELYNQYSRLSNPQRNYWLGQAYFNTGSFENAAQVFANLEQDEQFGFRSKVMVGIIMAAKEEFYDAIDLFEGLVREYDSSEPYYDFAVLQFGRISAQMGYFEKALLLYDDYFRYRKHSYPSDLAYEFSLLAKEAERYEIALYNLRNIINQPDLSRYFAPALSQIAIIQAEKDDISTARLLVGEIMGNNNTYCEILAHRADKMNALRKEVETYLRDDVLKERKREEVRNLLDLLDDLKKRQSAIGDFGISRTDLEIIDFAAEEYSLLLQVILDTEDTVELIAKQPNDGPVERMRQIIDNTDKLRIELLTYKLLSTLIEEDKSQWQRILRPPEFVQRLIVLSETDTVIHEKYEQARQIAGEIVDYQNVLFDYNQANKQKEHDSENRMTLEEGIASLYAEAENEFGMINHDSEYVQQIEEELSAVASFREDLFVVKELVGKYYHERLAQRLARANMLAFENSDNIFEFNVGRIDKFVDDLQQMNLEYSYALLDVQFIEAMKMQREYDTLRRSTIQQESVIEEDRE